MAIKTGINKDSETTLERTKRLVAEVEEMIRTTGEHPEFELKMSWKRDNPYLKAEFIKDVQSIANSNIPIGKAKFVIVGANEGTREITGCNPSDYDEAKIRQLLETYLDSVPDFEILYPIAENGNTYVAFRFLHQTKRPFVIKAEIVDEKNKKYLSIGEIWLKPSNSTGKRRIASRTDLMEMVDIEALVNNEVEVRITKLLPEIRLEARTQLGNYGVTTIPPLLSTDEEFEHYIEQIIATSDSARFNVLFQKLHDKCVENWENKIEVETALSIQEMREEIDTIFVPTMKRLALLGLLLIKYDASLDWFNKIADLLIETFNISENLSNILPADLRFQKADSLANLANSYVPALESLMVANLLIAYEIKKKSNVKFSSLLFPRLVKYKSDSYNSPGTRDVFYLFYPFYSQTIDRRIDLLTAERYQDLNTILSFFGSEKSLKKSLLQVIALIDWLSFLSYEELSKEPQTAKFFDTKYPKISTGFNPVYIQESLDNITPLVEKIWSDLPSGTKNFFILDPDLAEVFSGLTIGKRKEIFARFLMEAFKNHAQRMYALMRFPIDPYWNEEINRLIESLKGTT